MKKIISFVFFQLCVIGVLLAAPINSKMGYKNLPWGSTVEEAKSMGFKVILDNAAASLKYNTENYSEPIESYLLKSNDTMVLTARGNYYQGKLFEVTEILDLSDFNLKKLESRYGNFSEQGIFQLAENNYMNAQFDSNKKVISFSISLSLANGSVVVMLRDWNVYKKVSYLGQELAGISEEEKTVSLVNELATLADKLIQQKADGSKASFAFMAFTTDYKNTLVENYITDALTEAMFNTGKIKIIERSNLEAILAEQKFQSSGLVNEETAKSIGMLAGVDFVCYGTLKDLGEGFTVNARVVDVETGEICAMARTSIEKDDYLQQQAQGSVSVSKTSGKTTAQQLTTKKAVPTVSNNLWQVSSYRNDFDGFTSYTFTVKAASGEMCFLGYKKCDIQTNSRVFAGVYWPHDGVWTAGDRATGSYDFKLNNGSVINKNLNDLWKNYLDQSEKNYFYFAWNDDEGARWLLEMFTQNDLLTVRKDKVVRKFQTAGLLDKMAEVGITWEEIDAAMANEEF